MKSKSNYYLLTFNQDWADEHNVPALACMDEETFKNWSETKLSIHAHLGNGGDCFMEDEQGLTGKELIKQGYVEKFNVDESFVKTFNKAGLADLSLSNVFDSEEFEDEDAINISSISHVKSGRKSKTCGSCFKSIAIGKPSITINYTYAGSPEYLNDHVCNDRCLNKWKEENKV